MENYIALFTTVEDREDCEIKLDKQLDVAFSMVTEIEGTKKSDVVHDLLKTYINKHIADKDIQTLAEYSQRKKKTDVMGQQLARLVAMEKVMESASRSAMPVREENEDA